MTVRVVKNTDECKMDSNAAHTLPTFSGILNFCTPSCNCAPPRSIAPCCIHKNQLQGSTRQINTNPCAYSQVEAESPSFYVRLNDLLTYLSDSHPILFLFLVHPCLALFHCLYHHETILQKLCSQADSAFLLVPSCLQGHSHL